MKERSKPMGVFDFARDVGAKVGLGKSSNEIKTDKGADAAEKAVAAAQARSAAVAAKDASKNVAAQAKQAAADKQAADKQAARAAATEKRREAKAAERFAEYNKSIELERYVKDLGMNAHMLDIRYDDGVAYVTGEAPDAAMREKIILTVGNAEGVGKVVEEMTVAAQPEVVQVDPDTFHTVQAGDTLWAIAERAYGDGNRYPEIFEANKPMLSDPDLIFPGQVLRCPK